MVVIEENAEIVDRADTIGKLEYKKMLNIRKLKHTINTQTEGEFLKTIKKKHRIRIIYATRCTNISLKNQTTKTSQNKLNIKTNRLEGIL